MSDFNDAGSGLFCEEVSIARIAGTLGTPFYLYSHRTLVRNFRAYGNAFKEFPHLICYAAKASSNLSILRIFTGLGGGLDIVSGGELFRALKAGVPSSKITFAGAGKTRVEIASALRAGILMFNVESEQELFLIDEVAGLERNVAPVSLRVNPEVDPGTHPYISTGMKESKFGLDMETAMKVYEEARNLKNIRIVGIHQHIGSQLTETRPFVDAVSKITGFIRELRRRGIQISYLDIGGGLGISYKDERPPDPAQLAEALRPLLKDIDCTLVLEPGRSLTGNAGILVTRVLYVKTTPEKTFIIVDAGMNDLIRPSLYDAYHEIRPVISSGLARQKVDVVGPVCESGDFFAREREIEEVKQGDLLAVMNCGAYGFSMTSRYNSRPNIPEVLAHGNQYDVIREREEYEDLIRGEKIPPFLMKG